MTVLAEDLAALVAALDAGREVSLSIVGWERENEPQFFTATLRPVAGNRRAFADVGDRAQLAAFLRDLANALAPVAPFDGRRTTDVLRAPPGPSVQAIGSLRLETLADGMIRYTSRDQSGADAPHGSPCSRCMNPAPKSALFEGRSYRGCERCSELGRPVRLPPPPVDPATPLVEHCAHPSCTLAKHTDEACDHIDAKGRRFGRETTEGRDR